MAAVQRINTTDQVNVVCTKSDSNFQELETGLKNPTTGHTHNGVDSKTVDHKDLDNIGIKDHETIDSEIGTLQQDLSTHTGDEDPHASANEKSLWNGVADEVEEARTSTTHGAFDTLDERLENIETTAAPDSHQSLTEESRTTEATQLSDSTHPAKTIWDETSDQHVQDTLDGLVEDVGSLQSNAVLKTGVIDAIINTEETAKIPLTNIETIEVAEENVDCGTTPAPLGGGTTSPLTQDEVNDAARRVWVPNLCRNGVFIYQGCYYTGGQAYNARGFNADAYGEISTQSGGANVPYGLPGWHWEKTSTYANSVVRQYGASGPTGTNSEFDSRYIEIIANLDGDHPASNTTTMLVSDLITVTPNKVHTICFWYRWTSGSDKQTPSIYIKQSGSTLKTETLTTGTNTWTQVRKVFTPTQSTITIEFPANYTVGSPSTKHSYQIGPIGLWEGDYTNGELPRIWYNRELQEWAGEGDYGSTNTAPTVSNTKTFKSRYHVEIPVTDALSSPLTINIPVSVYVYDVRISADYALGAVPYWGASSAVDFRTPFGTVNIYVAPPTTAGNIFVDVDYWPVVE